ncbi:MAG: hypothetical protein JSV64_01315 [Candidatus Bathyarchaeota archaeon]|nr:MAG: hypothetical protein JSV64_01315 [Candidatus Bathyarchaeota archaeon]
MHAREGDLLETEDKTIFDIKGLTHPPGRIIAFPRFVSDTNGDRKRGCVSYRKVYALQERYLVARDRFPQFLVQDPVLDEILCEVPTVAICNYYNPVDGLNGLRRSSTLDELEVRALRFTALLKQDSEVAWNKLGITGSILAKLHAPNSDIDAIVYGEENCRRVIETLKSHRTDMKGDVRRYSMEQLRKLYHFRSQDTQMPFADFAKAEARKALQGKYLQHDFYVRCIRDWNEIDEEYGDIVYKKTGYARIKATICDDSESIFTPCRYLVDDAIVLEGTFHGVIKEVVSYRGRFCEQARRQETVFAQGKVEKVKKGDETYFRLLLGSKPSDFMIIGR